MILDAEELIHFSQEMIRTVQEMMQIVQEMIQDSNCSPSIAINSLKFMCYFFAPPVVASKR